MKTIRRPSEAPLYAWLRGGTSNYWMRQRNSEHLGARTRGKANTLNPLKDPSTTPAAIPRPYRVSHTQSTLAPKYNKASHKVPMGVKCQVRLTPPGRVTLFLAVTTALCHVSKLPSDPPVCFYSIDTFAICHLLAFPIFPFRFLQRLSVSCQTYHSSMTNNKPSKGWIFTMAAGASSMAVAPTYVEEQSFVAFDHVAAGQ